MGLFLLLEIFRGLHIIMQKKWEVLGMIGVDLGVPYVIGTGCCSLQIRFRDLEVLTRGISHGIGYLFSFDMDFSYWYFLMISVEECF